MDTNERIVNKLNSDGEWEDCSWSDLRTGDGFRMSEPDGTLVLFNGSTLMIAASDPYFNEEGIGQIEIVDE